jgi:hypothetical protein
MMLSILKKAVAISVILLLIISTVACGTNTGTAKKPTGTNGSTNQATSEIGSESNNMDTEDIIGTVDTLEPKEDVSDATGKALIDAEEDTLGFEEDTLGFVDDVLDIEEEALGSEEDTLDSEEDALSYEEDVLGNEENKAEENSKSDYLDLTALSSIMVYSEVNNIMVNPEEYIGKTIKISGPYNASFWEETGIYYHYVIISDATACCQSGLEFIWDDNSHIYPKDYPENDTEIEVEGVFSTYEELGVTYYYLKTDEITVK